jgi:hypothetical protein
MTGSAQDAGADVALMRSPYHRAPYNMRDKVMQIENNYDRAVYNGDIGFVAEVAYPRSRWDFAMPAEGAGFPVHCAHRSASDDLEGETCRHLTFGAARCRRRRLCSAEMPSGGVPWPDGGLTEAQYRRRMRL